MIRRILAWAGSWVDYWGRAVRHPRMYLLEWAHRFPVGAACYVAVAACVVAGVDLPRWLVLTLGWLAAPSVWLALVAQVAHWAWDRGWLLRGVDCPCCGPRDDDGPGGGPDDPDDGPDGPDDSGLIAEIEQWLRTVSAAQTHQECVR